MPYKPGAPFRGTQTFEVNTAAEFVQTMHDIPQPHFYARGEPCEYEDPWMPGIWRGDHAFGDQTPVIDGGYYTKGELEALEQCQADLKSGEIEDNYFTSLFDVDQPIELGTVHSLHWTALAQHYNQDQRYPTRLLDVTTDAFAALFFAVSSQPDEDGFVFWSEVRNQCNDLSKMPETETAGVFFDILRIRAADGGPDYVPSEETLNYMRPPLPNRRTEAQRGAFVWARQNDHHYFRNSLAMRIPANSKAELLVSLSRLNYTNERMYP